MIDIHALGKSEAADALRMVCEAFVMGSVLHKAMNISIDEYLQYLREPFLAAIDEGMSLVAVDTSTSATVGCILAREYSGVSAKIPDVPMKIRPINALLAELEKKYLETREITPGLFMLVDIAVVSPVVRGQGIYRKLREKSQDLGQSLGYTYVIGELSSAATQHLCVDKMGHQIKSEIEYATFEFQGSRPFESIEKPRSIQLVEGRLASS